jgi:hypothetical protein
MEFPVLNDLSIYHQKVDLIKATAAQIQKDFSLFDQKITFSGQTETAYCELNNQIVPIVDRFLEINSSNFFALLYAIDIDEKQLKRVLFGDEFDKPATEISRMIIERELKKVIVRNFFKTQEKS